MRQRLAKAIAAYILHTPPHPGRGILGKIAWWIYPEPVMVRHPDGFAFKVRLYDSEDINFADGRWEPHHDRHVFVSHLCEGMTVMDVGANLGLYSLLISRKVGTSGKVYAFEPVPEIFARLKEHIALNNATNIVPVQVALSDEKGIAKMSVSGGSSSLFRHKTSQFVEVPMTTLDDFVAEHGIARVDAIKLDVEGGELKVIRGADKTIRRDNPILMVEINFETLPAAGTSPEELFRTITSYGYNAFVIRHGKAVSVKKVVEPLHGTHLDNYLFIPR